MARILCGGGGCVMCNDDEVVVGVDVDGVFIVVVGRTKRHNVTKSQCVTLASTFNVARKTAVPTVSIQIL